MVCLLRHPQHGQVLWVCLLPLLASRGIHHQSCHNLDWQRYSAAGRGKVSTPGEWLLGPAAQSHSCPDPILGRDLLYARTGDLQKALMVFVQVPHATLRVTLGSAAAPAIHPTPGQVRAGGVVCTQRRTRDCPGCSPPLPWGHFQLLSPLS